MIELHVHGSRWCGSVMIGVIVTAIEPPRAHQRSARLGFGGCHSPHSFDLCG